MGRREPVAAVLPFSLRALRHFSASSHAGDKLSGDVLGDLLGNAKAVAIRLELGALAEVQTHMRYAEFADVVKANSGGDTKESEVAEACRTLQAAGVIIRLEDVVYLHPSELTRDVLRALPTVPSSVFGVTEEEMRELEAELVAMHAEIEKAAASARFNSNTIVGAGLLLLCTQLAVFVRLTYVELSWDVMEPLSYFVGVGNAILVYIYFMVYKRDFTFGDWSTRLHDHFRWKNIRLRGIDHGRYTQLLRKLRRK